MNVNISLDLQAIISAAVSAERIQPIVDKAISEAIKSAIQEATGYRSEFSNALKTQLSAALPSGLGIDDAARFQLVMNQAVTEAVRGENAAIIQAAMKTAIKEVMPDVPARIKLSEFIELARGGLHKEDHEGFYALLELSDYGSGWLYLDGDEDCREKYRAENRISFSKDGSVYALKLNSLELTPKTLPTAVCSFNGLLLSMYVGRTSIELDMSADDVEYAASSRED